MIVAPSDSRTMRCRRHTVPLIERRSMTPPVRTHWNPGDWVVYRKQKRSSRPGPRARIIGAAEKGDTYAYLVDKYWVVVKVAEGRLTLRTRRGKLHEIDSDDPRLRKANLWERWALGHRFRAIDAALPTE